MTDAHNHPPGDDGPPAPDPAPDPAPAPAAMSPTHESDPLLARLRSALRAAAHPLAEAPLQKLPDQGLAHDHVRLLGSGALARCPKQSQMGLAAGANLDYQSACFERASASGHAPRLLGRLDPSAALPRGALLVQEISGQPARLPADLPAIVDALAALHRLPLPAAAQRAPLLDAADALAAMQAEIAGQAQFLDAAHIAPAARRVIDQVAARWQRVLAGTERPPRRFTSFDAHPGNFLVTAAGQAVLVDLEKARYSCPTLDLAHATLYTSTTWDVASHAELSVDQVAQACLRWLQRMDEPGRWQPWLLPLRAAMWLWAVTWCAKWRVLSAREPAAAADGEDWSAARSDEALVRHVRGRVDCYLGLPAVQRVADELDALAQRLGHPAQPWGRCAPRLDAAGSR